MNHKRGFILCLSIGMLILTLACGTSGTSSAPPKATPRPVTLSGSGDDVIDVKRLQQHTKASLIHTGSRNFIVVPYDASNNRRSSLVNEIGAYEGTVKWDQRADTLEITADGEWTITVQ